MSSPVLVFSSAYPCPGQWKIFRITFLYEGKVGRKKKEKKWRQISGRIVHHLKGWEGCCVLQWHDLPPLMEPPAVTSSCLEVEEEEGREEGCHGWTLQGRARSIVRSRLRWELMVLSIPRGSLGSSCVQLGLVARGAREEESVESCRIERHSVAVLRLASWRSVDYLPLDVCCGWLVQSGGVQCLRRVHPVVKFE